MTTSPRFQCITLPSDSVAMAGADFDAMTVELVRLQTNYQRAVWFLQDIASLAGTTKRKQAGCEIAAHALAQLGEPRHGDGDGLPTDGDALRERPDDHDARPRLRGGSAVAARSLEVGGEKRRED